MFLSKSLRRKNVSYKTTRQFCQGRSWQPGGALSDLPEDVMTVERIENQKRKTDVARSLVGGDVHGKHRPRLERWSNRALFRRGGLDKKFKTAEEAAHLLVNESLRRDPHQKNFASQLSTFLQSILPLIERSPHHAWVVKHLAEPERSIHFRVPWTDDDGNPRINRGFRLQYSSALGPFFGGVRFSANVNASSVRALAFETTLQNSLTGLPLGGARGGSDFSPVGKSESEIRSFCQSYIRECASWVGMGDETMDIPIGDLGVGEREMGYMYGACKEMHKSADIAMGGRAALSRRFFNTELSSSKLTREICTGLGIVTAAEMSLKDVGQTLEGKRCLISGSGNVALSVADALLDAGAIPISLSDTSGFAVEDNGFTADKLALVRMVKQENPYSYHRRISEYSKLSSTAKFCSGKDISGDEERFKSKPVERSFSRAGRQEDGSKDSSVAQPKLSRTLTRGTDDMFITDTSREESGNRTGSGLWDVPCDYAFPCAGEYELTAPKAYVYFYFLKYLRFVMLL